MTKEYYKTKESVEEYIKLAKDVNGQELINKLVNVLSKNSSLLEIGSGPGTDWKILNAIYDVTGSDFSTEFLNHLRIQNPKGKFLILDAITLKSENKFDGLYSNKVLHHLKIDELKESVKRQYDLLNEGGIICHSFWKGEGSEIFNGLYVQYHNRQSLEANFSDFFEIISIDEYEEFEENDSLLLIAKKNSNGKI